MSQETDELKALTSSEFLRPILLTVHQQITTRIFDQGKDARENQIGKYSEAYIKRRVKKGLGSSSKVVLEFTGQMRNDFVLLVGEDEIASGFNNSFNAQKSEWVERTYNKTIFDVSPSEDQLLSDLLEAGIQSVLNG